VRASGAVLYAEAELPASPAAHEASDGQPVQRLIVKYRGAGKSGAAAVPDDTQRRVEALAGQALRAERTAGDGARVLGLSNPLSARTARTLVAAIAGEPGVEYAEPDRRAFAQSVAPDDPMFAQQWNLIDSTGGIGISAAWALTTGSATVPIAIIDSGMLPHPDLAGRYVGGYDFVSDPRNANDGDGRDADPTDPGDWLTPTEVTATGSPFAGCAATNSTWHGTRIAGIVAAVGNNEAGIAGINWRSPIVPVRVIGKCGAGVADIADAIRWSAGLPVPGVPANAHPARVLNLSLAGVGECGRTLQSAIDDALAAGAVVVAAAGNAGQDAANYFPANCNGVIAVAGSTREGGHLSVSNYGARIALAAPSGGFGGNITTTRNAGMTVADPRGYDYDMGVGTSLAAPHVAAVASLLLSIDAGLTPSQVQAILQQSARTPPKGTAADCTTLTCGAGLLDAGAAVMRAAAETTVPAVPPSPQAPVPTAEPPPAFPVADSVLESAGARMASRDAHAPAARPRGLGW
jgi:serine protease